MMIIIKLIAHLLLITNLSVAQTCDFNGLLTQIGLNKPCSPTIWDQTSDFEDPGEWINIGTTMLSGFLGPIGGFGPATTMLRNILNAGSMQDVLQSVFTQMVECIDTRIAADNKVKVENRVIGAAQSWENIVNYENTAGLEKLAAETASTVMTYFGVSSTNSLTIIGAETLLPSAKTLSDIYWLILTAELGSYKDEFYAERNSPNEWGLMYDIKDIDVCDDYKDRVLLHQQRMGFLQNWIQRSIDLIKEHYKPTALCRVFVGHDFVIANPKTEIVCGRATDDSCYQWAAVNQQALTQQFDTWFHEEVVSNFISRIEDYMWVIGQPDNIICDMDKYCEHHCCGGVVWESPHCLAGYHRVEIVIEDPFKVYYACLDDRFYRREPTDAINVCYAEDESNEELNPCHWNGAVCPIEEDCNQYVLPAQCPAGFELGNIWCKGLCDINPPQ